MISLRAGRSSPGQNIIIFKNVNGSTILRGSPVCLDHKTVDGVSILTPAITGSLGLFQGVAFDDIPDGEFGKVQVGGWCDFARVGNHTANATAVGDILTPIVGQTYFQRLAAPDGRPGFAYSLEAIAAAGVVTVVSRKIQLGGILGV